MPNDQPDEPGNDNQSQDDKQDRPTIKKAAEEPAVAGYTLGDLAKAPAEPPDPKPQTSEGPADASTEKQEDNQPPQLAAVQEKVIRSDQQEPTTKHKTLVIAGIALIALGALIMLPIYGLRPTIITMLAGFALVVTGTFIKI